VAEPRGVVPKSTTPDVPSSRRPPGHRGGSRRRPGRGPAAGAAAAAAAAPSASPSALATASAPGWTDAVP